MGCSILKWHAWNMSKAQKNQQTITRLFTRMPGGPVSISGATEEEVQQKARDVAGVQMNESKKKSLDINGDGKFDAADKSKAGSVLSTPIKKSE